MDDFPSDDRMDRPLTLKRAPFLLEHLEAEYRRKVSHHAELPGKQGLANVDRILGLRVDQTRWR